MMTCILQMYDLVQTFCGGFVPYITTFNTKFDTFIFGKCFIISIISVIGNEIDDGSM